MHDELITLEEAAKMFPEGTMSKELMERFRKVCASKTANKGNRRKAHEQ